MPSDSLVSSSHRYHRDRHLVAGKNNQITLPLQPRLGNRGTDTKDTMGSKPRLDLVQANHCHLDTYTVSLLRAATQFQHCEAPTTLARGHVPPRQHLRAPPGVRYHLLRRPDPSECHPRISLGTPFRRCR